MSERPQTSMFRQRQATLQQQTQSPLEDVRLDIGGSVSLRTTHNQLAIPFIDHHTIIQIITCA